MRRLDDTVRRQKEVLAAPSVEVSVVITGLLRLRQQYDVGKFNDGTLHGRGYGHWGHILANSSLRRFAMSKFALRSLARSRRRASPGPDKPCV